MTDHGKVAAGLSAVLLLLMFPGGSGAQHHSGMPVPPQPAVREESGARTPVAPHRVDLVELEREAHELSVLASSVPEDVSQIKKGLLPKDAADKLKRIERLAKQLRGQIQQ